MAKKLSKSEIHSVVKKAIADSEAFAKTELAYDRARLNLDYQGVPNGKTKVPTKPGRSSVVDRTVFQTVETVMPSLVRLFCNGEAPGQFIPVQVQDEASANEASERVHWIYAEKNDGYRNTVEWLKSGLLNKFSVAKCWYDDTPIITPERYEGISEEELLALKADRELELLVVEAYDDPDYEPLAHLVAPAATLPAQPVEGMPLPVQPLSGSPLPGAMLAPVATQVPQKYDVKAKRTCKSGYIRVAVLAPERFLFPRMATDLDDCPALTHQEPTRVSDLIGQGYPADALKALPAASTTDVDPDARARFESLEKYGVSRDELIDDSAKEVMVNETFCRIDADRDGYAEYLLVKTAGQMGEVLLEIEAVDEHPFVLWSPVIQPHRMIGSGVADQVDDIQHQRTAISRIMLDALYTGTNTQLIITPDVREEDVINRVPGGVIRSDRIDGVRVLEQIPVIEPALRALAHIDVTAEQRTGLTRFAMQGIDPNEPANRTAAGVRTLSQAGRDRIELIARNFGEQALKPLYRKILRLIKKHQNEKYEVFTNGRWIRGNPTVWRNDYSYTVTVGLGTGDRDDEMNKHLIMFDLDAKIIQMQGGTDGPFLTKANVYNKLRKFATAAGVKNPDAYYSNPANAPPQPQQPQVDPLLQAQVEKMRAEMQIEQMKAQHRMKLEETEMLLKIELEKQKAGLEANLEQVKLNAKLELEAIDTHGKLAVEAAKAARDASRDATAAEVRA